MIRKLIELDEGGENHRLHDKDNDGWRPEMMSSQSVLTDAIDSGGWPPIDNNHENPEKKKARTNPQRASRCRHLPWRLAPIIPEAQPDKETSPAPIRFLIGRPLLGINTHPVHRDGESEKSTNGVGIV
ncbi:hypothetical protein [endosymbiont of Lamellibrachia barhami]|uniref:hypothetical protein n=1 Tax=endosymbiont of Lamellibrachia barhami TaxID=205975 RepID=UPI0015B1E585|nr:hypothetical protein [endosymbiont of Lamellibrachia barhami]